MSLFVVIQFWKDPGSTQKLQGGGNERPGTDHGIWGPMRGLKNNGRLLCSHETSFIPLGPDGKEPTSLRTWRLYDWIGPVGPIQWEKKISTFRHFIIPRRYGPLRGPTSSSCRGLWHSPEGFLALWAEKQAIRQFLVSKSNLGNFE